jgi:hypothetical protein
MLTNALVPAPKTFKIKPKRIVAAAPWTPDPLFTPKTPGEEAEYLVAEWYAAHGEVVPAAEVGMGAAMDAADRAREDMIAYVNDHYKGEVPALLYGTSEFWAWIEAQVAELKARTPEEAAAVAAAEAAKPKPAGPKPEFGTPEFWVWARRRKAEKLAEEAAKEAAAAAAGLPSPAAVAAEKKAKAAAKKAAKAQAEAAKAPA